MGDGNSGEEAVCCGETALHCQGSWVSVKALAPSHCVNSGTLLPVSGAELHLPGMGVLHKDSRVCSGAKMLGSKELYLRCE